MLLTQHWSWYPGQQMEGINDTPKTLGRYSKKGIKPLGKFILAKINQGKKKHQRESLNLRK